MTMSHSEKGNLGCWERIGWTDEIRESTEALGRDILGSLDWRDCMN